MGRKLTTSTFIEKSILKHGIFYDYSRTEYKGSANSVIIICPSHGEFLQIANTHMQGSGCPKCYREIRKYINLKTQSDFLKSANIVHNDKYQYSEYINDRTKIIIFCPFHGEFKQTPNDHLQGHGCRKCGSNIITQKTIKKQSDFIEECNQKHNFFYDNRELKYTNAHNKVKIICPEHGLFLQSANHHRRGSKCPKCIQKSTGENLIRQFLNKNKITFEEQKRFADCVNKKQLPFDFYIKDLQILVEYQGRQHFEPVKWSNNWNDQDAYNNLIETQKNDSIKKEWCSKNNIKLIKISYLDKFKIEEILKENGAI